MLSDHVVHPEKIASKYPYREDGQRPWEAPDHWPDVWVAMAAMGAVTRRLRFLTGVYVVPMRNPFHLAKAIGTAAVLTNYRVELGIGLGWMRDEFALLGEDFDSRAARTGEMIEVMRKLWTGEMVEHHGRFYDFDRLNMRPAVRGAIPLIVGGVTDAALRRTARIGDGWIPHAIPTAEARDAIAAIRRYRERVRPRRGAVHRGGSAHRRVRSRRLPPRRRRRRHPRADHAVGALRRVAPLTRRQARRPAPVRRRRHREDAVIARGLARSHSVVETRRNREWSAGKESPQGKKATRLGAFPTFTLPTLRSTPSRSTATIVTLPSPRLLTRARVEFDPGMRSTQQG